MTKLQEKQDRNKRLIQYRKEGLSINELARRFNISTMRVSQILKREEYKKYE
jgi:DNA-directed RNA polymerase specialized sigma subunit